MFQCKMEPTNGTSGAPTSGTSGAPTNVTAGAVTNGTTEAPTDAAAKKGIMDNVDKKKVMETAFAELKSQGKNTVEGLLNYFKERNILDDSTEKIAKTALAGVSDPKNIDYAKFAEVFGSVAKEKGYDMEHLTQSVARTLFGGGPPAWSASSNSSPTAVGDANTSAKPAAVEHYDESDDHHEPIEDHFKVSDDHHELSEEYQESDDDHCEPSDNHDSTNSLDSEDHPDSDNR